MTDASERHVALVTGGGSGIGRATAQLLATEGYDVVVCGRNADKLAATLDLIGHERCSYEVADMSDSAAAGSVVGRVAEDRGRLDVLINAHGILGTMAPLAELTADDVRQALNTNLLGPVMATKAAAPFLARTGGCVVNVISINALQAEPDAVPYGISKTGLMGFTRYAAVELAPRGIRVNAVLPGWVKSPMTDFILDPVVDTASFTANMMGRPADPMEIAHVIAFLAGPGASYMTGSCVVADGGQVVALASLSSQA